MAIENDDLLECLTSAQETREQEIEPNATADTKVCKKRVDIVITVTRKEKTDDTTLGTFDARRVGAEEAVTGGTLEPKTGTYSLGHGNKAYPIPAGTYNGHVRAGSQFTGKNGKVAAPYTHHAVELLAVPNFGDVLIHNGTKSGDTLGCILIGGATTVEEQPIKQGNKVVGTRRIGHIPNGTTNPTNWKLMDLIYTAKKDNDGEMPRITVIVKDI
jgi:uncharacterized protein DUF5675